MKLTSGIYHHTSDEAAWSAFSPDMTAAEAAKALHGTPYGANPEAAARYLIGDAKITRAGRLRLHAAQRKLSDMAPTALVGSLVRSLDTYMHGVAR